jgi:hypothetical protein
MGTARRILLKKVQHPRFFEVYTVLKNTDRITNDIKNNMVKTMTSRKISKYVLPTILGVSALSLTACNIGHPNSMPTGYTYHHQDYKSPTPAPSAKVTAKQRQNMDSVQAEQFRNAIYDLLNKLTMRAGLPPKPVYVLAPDPMTTFYANIDNDLRESMRTLGYAISDIPTGAYVFSYSAEELDYPVGLDIAGQPNVELTIRVFNSAKPDARQLTEEVGRYFIKGADTLYIKPTSYSQLPTYKRIKRQMEGFESYDPNRTASGALNTELAPENQQMPMVNYSRTMEPPPATNYTTRPIAPVTIDSAGVSYDPMIDQEYQPSTPRSRVSKKIDY